MPDYSRGKIYKIVCNETGLIYVGSTCEPTLARRLAKHVGDYKYWKNEKYHFVTSFKIIENNNYDIVLLENCPCENKDDLYKRERHYIETLDCVNKIMVGRSHKEYREDNIEKIKEENKKYREANKELRKEYQKIYYQDNKDKLTQQVKEYREVNKDKVQKSQKQYRDDNKEKMSLYNKKYSEINKEKMKFHYSQPYTCQCGKTFRVAGKARHERSEFHQNYIESLKQN